MVKGNPAKLALQIIKKKESKGINTDPEPINLVSCELKKRIKDPAQ
jgi:hypothetical protein